MIVATCLVTALMYSETVLRMPVSKCFPKVIAKIEKVCGAWEPENCEVIPDPPETVEEFKTFLDYDEKTNLPKTADHVYFRQCYDSQGRKIDQDKQGDWERPAFCEDFTGKKYTRIRGTTPIGP